MTETQCVVHTPFQKAHVHFYDFIESFPGLPEGESFDSHSKRLQTEVKYQFMTLKEDQAIRYIKMRDCFTFRKRFDVEFCLKERVGNVNLVQAAIQMGYYKYT